MCWSVVANPRKYGGLGIRRARLANITPLGNLVWAFLASPQKLWVQILSSKYLKGQLILHATAKGINSVIWKTILKATKELNQGERGHLILV